MKETPSNKEIIEIIDQSFKPILIFINNLASFWKSRRLHLKKEVFDEGNNVGVEYIFERSRAFGFIKRRDFMKFNFTCRLYKREKSEQSLDIQMFIPYHFPREEETRLFAEVERLRNDLVKKLGFNDKKVRFMPTRTYGYVGIWTGYVGMD